MIKGTLPSCEADQLLTLIPAQPPAASPGRQQREKRGQKRPLTPDERYDADLAAAMSASLTGPEVKGHSSEEEYDVDLATAISMSMQGNFILILSVWCFRQLYQSCVA